MGYVYWSYRFVYYGQFLLNVSCNLWPYVTAPPPIYHDVNQVRQCYTMNQHFIQVNSIVLGGYTILFLSDHQLITNSFYLKGNACS